MLGELVALVPLVNKMEVKSALYKEFADWVKNMSKEQNNIMKLIPGHFYRSHDQSLWCCFKVNAQQEKHAQAHCVRVSDHRIEYFYLDGRYDEKGEREHTLIEDMTEFWNSLQPIKKV